MPVPWSLLATPSPSPTAALVCTPADQGRGFG
jgi:hypothetical protein